MGAEHRDLGKHAPITEALIDIHASLPAGTDVGTLESLHATIRKDYPRKQQRNRIEAVLNLDEGHIDSTATEDGWLCTSADKSHVAQFRLAGFTFSRLKPYIGWNALIDETRRLWEIYSGKLKPTGVTRIATRFINQLTLPESADFDDFFTVGPRIPDGVAPRFNSYRSRVHVGDLRSNQGFVSLIVSPPASPDALPTVTLDIDTFRMITGDPIPPDSVQIWDILDGLRAYKNTLFFGSLKEEAIRLLSGDGEFD